VLNNLRRAQLKAECMNSQLQDIKYQVTKFTYSKIMTSINLKKTLSHTRALRN